MPKTEVQGSEVESQAETGQKTMSYDHCGEVDHVTDNINPERSTRL